MNPVLELLPTMTAFDPGQEVVVEIRSLRGTGIVRLLHLGVEVASVEVAGGSFVDFGPRAPGGYGVEVTVGGQTARTAVEVVAAGVNRCRYGFVADYGRQRDVDAVADNARRLHLTDILFYDWAYRHADLLGGGEDYEDALGQRISLETIRQLIGVLHNVGSRALGYAAVYAVGNDEWPDWSDIALLSASGSPHALGDFVSLVDPADLRWLAHFTADLRASVEKVGFDGFHLDQYGYPKRSVRPDETVVHVEDSFATLIAEVRAALPVSRLVFNNVNGFPVWRTTRSPQDVVYVEVWAPNLTLRHLVDVVRAAQAGGTGKPVVVAAYQHVFDGAPREAAELATAFTMATLFSCGATHLLCGEADRVLVDPYYVRNHVTADATAAMLRRWYDFLVEHVELLQDPEAVDVTTAMAGDYNGDCDVSYQGVAITDQPVAGTMWRRIVKVADQFVVHLVNLVGQDDTEWDAARKPPAELPSGELRVRRGGPGAPRVRVADPDAMASLVDVEVRLDGEYFLATLPPPHVWQMVVIDL